MGPKEAEVCRVNETPVVAERRGTLLSGATIVGLSGKPGTGNIRATVRLGKTQWDNIPISEISKMPVGVS